MIALTVILGFAALALFAYAVYRGVTDDEGVIPFVLGLAVGGAWLTMFIFISNVKLADSSLTGYIYSSDTFAGVTNYHIRFSETAGADSQPSFCVNSDAESKDELDELVGSGKKATVSIPATGWYFSDDIWHCPSDARLTSIESSTSQ